MCDIWLLQMGLQGPLGQLQRGVSDVVSEVEVINEDDVRQRWTATSAELWPVRLCGVMCSAAAKFLQSKHKAPFLRMSSSAIVEVMSGLCRSCTRN